MTKITNNFADVQKPYMQTLLTHDFECKAPCLKSFLRHQFRSASFVALWRSGASFEHPVCDSPAYIKL